MAKNKNLSKAKKAKNDEFYTRLEDIEREVFHYKKHFAGKVVYCNCDDPAESNFFKYFALNIKAFQIKKLIATCYDGSCIADTQLSLFDYENENEKTTKHAHKIELVPEDFDTTQITMDLVRKTIEEKHLIHKLKGNGDFRSEECIELLKEADIVCTNPPFSLFREYVAQLVEYDKKFLILGNPNAITYKEIFPLIKDNKVWVGFKSMGSDMYFRVKESYKEILLKTKKEGSGYKIIKNEIFGRAQAIWFTNLEHSKRNEELVLWKRYAEEPDHFPKYDNYDAINVDKVVEIPMDYEGVMGVPITFLDKYNPEQFEIVGLAPERLDANQSSLQIKRYINGIQHKKDGSTCSGNKVNDGPVIIHDTIPLKFPYYTCENEPGKYLEVLYARILVRNKKVEKREKS